MRWQMALHLDRYGGGFPIWVWARIRRYYLVANLRPRGADGEGSVVATLSISREHVFLTDYISWHDVLNGAPGLPERCPRCGAAFCDDEACLDQWYDGWADAWDARVPRDPQGQRLAWWEWPAGLRSELFTNWEVVRQVRRRWPVQGCVELIDAAWASSVRRPR